MKRQSKNIRNMTVAALLATVALPGLAIAGAPENSVKLLTANFESRDVVQIEAGDFHFKPGQIAPIHTHIAPAVGYVAKGEIIYQIEGEAPQILRAGDAFYEPAGPRILRFDNASTTKEAIFLDFNLEQAGEPFIVFEQAPTEAIDRRTLPTTQLGGRDVDQVDVFTSDLKANETLKVETLAPTLGIVAEGAVDLQIKGEATQRISAGESFSIAAGHSTATFVNVSPEATAKIITFRLK